MFDLIRDLGRCAGQALRAAFPDVETFPEELPLQRAGRSEFGDFQISACLQLGKLCRRPPRELAGLVAAALDGHPALARIEVAGPGFVNLTLRPEVIAGEVLRRARDTKLGLRPLGAGERVIIDYSSPNVAKPMHIGHIRSTIIGDALARTLRALGYQVIGDNHLGDWGTQFGKLIVAYRTWLDSAAYADNPVGELLRLYIKFVDEERRQRGEAAAPNQGEDEPEAETLEGNVPPLLAAARAELVKLQQGDPENVALWKQFVDVSLREFERVYRRLGVRFDETLGESFYNHLLADTVRRLEQAGVAEESQGALAVFFEKERDGEKLPPFLVRKGDGGFLYATTDLAAILYRVERWQPTRILYVTDERQQLHFRQLFATARRLGVRASLEHHWFGLMRLPEGTISTREGKLIGLEALLDEAERRAAEVARQHNPELGDEERGEVARVVGLGAVKYNDLSKDRQALVTFTWDRALSLQGNTAPYLQYAYARIRSILRKSEGEAAATQAKLPADASALEEELRQSTIERDLAMRLLAYAEVVEQVGRSARPHHLCDYLFELATAFSTFYNEHPVLKAEPRVRAARLELTGLVAATLRHGLDLLGIEVLERM